MMPLIVRRACKLLFIAVVAGVAACSQNEEAPSGPLPVRVDGSSTVYPLTQAAAADFATTENAAQVLIAESGTTAGFRAFCAGEIDIAGASRPIRTPEIIACFRNNVSYVEAPVGFDGITIVVHPSNPLTSMRLEDLATMWRAEEESQPQTWRQVNGQWRDQPLALYGPGSQSGTYDYFIEAVLGGSGQLRTDYTASEDDTIIVEGVASDPNAIGFLGRAYFAHDQSRLKALAIDGGGGPVDPTAEAIADGRYAPLSRPIFIYINAAALDRPEVARFVEFYISSAASLTTAVGYVPLPARAYEAYLERLRERRVGTAFSGRPATGLTIDQVLAAPLIEPSS